MNFIATIRLINYTIANLSKIKLYRLNRRMTKYNNRSNYTIIISDKFLKAKMKYLEEELY